MIRYNLQNKIYEDEIPYFEMGKRAEDLHGWKFKKKKNISFNIR